MDIDQEKSAGGERGTASGRTPGQERKCEDSENLSGERILKHSSASQRSLDLVLSVSMVMMKDWSGIVNKTGTGDVMLQSL